MRQIQIFILTFLCIQIAPGAPIQALTTEQLKEIMTTVPKTERTDFIKTNLMLGYTIEHLHQNESSENGELAVQIFNYFVDNQEAIRLRKSTLNFMRIMDSMCFPEPVGCIDPDDPGIRP